MLKILIICIVTGLAISVVFIYLLRRFKDGHFERIYPLVESRFANIKIGEVNSNFYFDGESADTIHDFYIWAGLLGDDRVALDRICRNSYGEYFRVIISQENDNTYVNHITAKQAALTLQGIKELDHRQVEASNISITPEENGFQLATLQPQFRIVIPGHNLNNPHPTGRAGSEEDRSTPALLRAVTRLPLDSFWFMTGLGFVVTVVTLFLLKPSAEYVATKDLISFTLTIFLPYFLILMIALVIFKRWQGLKFTTRHWFISIVSIPIKSGYGVLLAAFVYNLFVWIYYAK